MLGFLKKSNMKSKFPEDSKTIQTDIVLPADTNSIDTLFGGELMARMDKVGSIAAIKHSENIVVTASVNNISFGEPVYKGSILTIEALSLYLLSHSSYLSLSSLVAFLPRVEKFTIPILSSR